MDRIATSFTLPQAPVARGPLASLLALAALRRQRRCLAALDAHLLRDVGLTREEALSEAARPAWDAPGHWLR